MVERLRSVPLFSELPADDLARISRSVSEVTLTAGEPLFAEGDAGHHGYVIVEGELEVLKATDRRETLLAVRGPGEVIGEMALLQEAPRMASVRARSDAVLLCIPKAALDETIESSPSMARAMLSTLLARWEETNKRLRHTDRMAQLGTLTAGVAHELNNPAAAVKRASDQLADALAEYERAVSASSIDVQAVQEISAGAGGDASARDPLGRSDREETFERWLDEHGVADGWRLAPALIDAGYELADLERLHATSSGEPAAAVELAVAGATVEALVAAIARGAERLSSIVGALKSYSYLDQGAVQDVDIVQGIENTLLLLSHKLGGVEVVRALADDLPLITGSGAELNQVWTNLLDNAADAVSGADDPAIILRAARDGDDVVVEIEDNGPGIPPELLNKVFDPFFTTKPPGQGTGLGLQITQGIVVLDHRGSVDVESRPGRTVFRIRLPITRPGEREESP